MKLPDPVAFLADVAVRRGWEFTLLDTDSGFLCEVSDGRKACL